MLIGNCWPSARLSPASPPSAHFQPSRRPSQQVCRRMGGRASGRAGAHTGTSTQAQWRSTQSCPARQLIFAAWCRSAACVCACVRAMCMLPELVSCMRARGSYCERAGGRGRGRGDARRFAATAPWSCDPSCHCLMRAFFFSLIRLVNSLQARRELQRQQACVREAKSKVPCTQPGLRYTVLCQDARERGR
ncbi:hypothetical protein BS50DRAFT_232380 [Corynespora cassiicola Philippines]|uniref:Uncharacterized protein n=1 Tax=Corynespora cassiicola Philippines TaxID=1448308 RepID=A0A2T2P1V2_CORCC|nr:hypothetical protein BS50DRAFT_232380 [Corynespora cassiicola Philippines]